MSRRHVVVPGDCAASLAALSGVTVDELWSSPDNAELRSLRNSPYMLCAGDVITLPDTHRSAEVQPAGQHRVRAQVATVRLHLKLLDERWNDESIQGARDEDDRGTRSREPAATDPPANEPLSNVPYRLVVGGRTTEGTTSGEGEIDERIDARATLAQLVLEPGTEHERTISLHVGHLDPPEEDSGIAHRLSNLGFACDPGDGMVLMLRAFQESRGLRITGELDDATRARILEDSGH